MSDKPVIAARGLSIEYRIGQSWLPVLHEIDLEIQPVQIHGLVGESGSGKSTLGLGMMRYLAGNGRIASGQIWFEDRDLVALSETELSRIWGRAMSLVPQNPLDALNPTLIIGAQMAEVTQLHLGLTSAQARQQAVDDLTSVNIADPARILGRYPHQLSGGMQQRVMIAMALSTRPQLLILDEPTTALDVTTQAGILDLVRALTREEKAAALYISHDLGTIAQVCDHVTVLYAGEVMECASVHALFARPIHPYTIGLLNSLPSAATGAESRLATIPGVAASLEQRTNSCVFADRCQVAIDKCHNQKPPLEQASDGRLVRCWRWQEISTGDLRLVRPEQGQIAPAPPHAELVLEARNIRKTFSEARWWERLLGRRGESVKAVEDISVRVRGRSTLGIVGESGSGKTTLARALVALDPADAGQIELMGRPISFNLHQRDRATLRNLRMIFQNPNDALNPFRTVGATIERTYRQLNEEHLNDTEIRTRVIDLLEAVGLSADYYHRLPTQLSGGEKQRVAIARAFAANPALIIADEPTSALDVSVQAVILNLLKDLRARNGASYVIISHDLEVISYVADWIVVMYLGQVVEEGTTEQVYATPSHPYTEALLSAIPLPDPTRRLGNTRLEGDIPSPRHKPAGCYFHTRCPRYIGDICKTQTPPVRMNGDGHAIRCHYTLEELEAQQKQEAPPS